MPDVIQANPNSMQTTLECTDGHYLKPISSNINYRYQQVGRPKVLVLLGRQFGSELSQWQADSRETISTMNRAFQGSNQAKDTRDSYRMTEKRQIIQTNISPGMQAFHKGFSEYLQAAGIGMVNYDSILRQAQRKNEITGLIDRSTDKREVEADAILDNVDILVEILDAGSITVMGRIVDKVQLRITRMDNFETIAQHIGIGSEYYKTDESWETNQDGYNKVNRIFLHHADIGYQKAEELFPLALNQAYIQTPDKGVNQDERPKIKKKKRVLPPGQ
jgi:hypothetical protein